MLRKLKEIRRAGSQITAILENRGGREPPKMGHMGKGTPATHIQTASSALTREVSMTLVAPIVDEIAKLLADQKLVPFFGAGISRQLLGVGTAELAADMRRGLG